MRTTEIETTIAQGIHATNDSAGYDEACKRILSEKSVLARIMKACLAEYKDCDVNEITGRIFIAAVRFLPSMAGNLPILIMKKSKRSILSGFV